MRNKFTGILIAMILVTSSVSIAEENIGTLWRATKTTVDDKRANVGDTFKLNQTIRTTKSSRAKAEVKTIDSSRYILYKNSSLRFESLSMDGSECGGMKVTLIQGKLRGTSGKCGNGKTEIKTTAASAFAWGTDYEIRFITESEATPEFPAGFYQKVNEGKVKVVNPLGSVLIHPGEAGFVSSMEHEPIIIDIPDFFTNQFGSAKKDTTQTTTENQQQSTPSKEAKKPNKYKKRYIESGSSKIFKVVGEKVDDAEDRSSALDLAYAGNTESSRTEQPDVNTEINTVIEPKTEIRNTDSEIRAPTIVQSIVVDELQIINESTRDDDSSRLIVDANPTEYEGVEQEDIKSETETIRSITTYKKYKDKKITPINTVSEYTQYKIDIYDDGNEVKTRIRDINITETTEITEILEDRDVVDYTMQTVISKSERVQNGTYTIEDTELTGIYIEEEETLDDGSIIKRFYDQYGQKKVTPRKSIETTTTTVTRINTDATERQISTTPVEIETELPSYIETLPTKRRAEENISMRIVTPPAVVVVVEDAPVVVEEEEEEEEETPVVEEEEAPAETTPVVNQAPVLSSKEISVQENQLQDFSVNIVAIDSEGESISYGINGIDSRFLSIDANTGELKFNPEVVSTLYDDLFNPITKGQPVLDFNVTATDSSGKESIHGYKINLKDNRYRSAAGIITQNRLNKDYIDSITSSPFSASDEASDIGNEINVSVDDNGVVVGLDYKLPEITGRNAVAGGIVGNTNEDSYSNSVEINNGSSTVHWGWWKSVSDKDDASMADLGSEMYILEENTNDTMRLPTTGTIEYEQMVNHDSRVVSAEDGSRDGFLLSAASLDINFDTDRVAPEITVTRISDGDQTTSLAATGALYRDTGRFTAVTNEGLLTGLNLPNPNAGLTRIKTTTNTLQKGDAYFSGMMMGNGGSHAGMGYVLSTEDNSSNMSGVVQGTVLLRAKTLK